MEVLVLNGENCKTCYKCIRECTVKAIKIENDKAKIIPELCILCDRCINSCPNHAKSVINNIEDVKQLIAEKEKVILSVAPSFISNFEVDNFEQFRQAVKKVGFYDAEETSVGARYVTNQYRKDLESGKYVNYITSACPSVVRYIQLFFPNALKYVAKVDSPMVAHGKILRKKYGNDIGVVFVGPCIAKKREAFESKSVDYALTFIEFYNWLKEEKIVFDRSIPENKDEEENRAPFYSVTRGIIKSFNNNFVKGYEYLTADGISSITEILENIDKIKGVFLEMDICHFSCVSGPCTINEVHDGGPIKAVEMVRKYANGYLPTHKDVHNDVNLDHPYKEIKSPLKMPSEEEIRKILVHIGKKDPSDELNCRACGYMTCREKAIAVYNGLADPEFCLPYLQKKAENFSNEIIASSPNGIFTINDKGNIIAINYTAKQIFNLDCNETYQDVNYHDLLTLDDFDMAMATKQPFYNRKIYVEDLKKYIEASFVYVNSHNIWVGFFKDITREELNAQKIKKLREDTMEVTSRVIDKQMRSVQEIASLLGETTAETKIALVKFKESLKENDIDNNEQKE